MAHKTDLTSDQMRQCLAHGASIADIRALQSDGFSFEEILSFCETSQARQDTVRQQAAADQAFAQKKAMRPENETHPGKSVFSFPEGDVARPRPEFSCPTFWVGGRCDYDTSTAKEIELLNAVPPGVYVCTKADGSRIPVRVEVQRDPGGKPTQKEFWFPTKDEHRHNQATQVAMLTEMLAHVHAPVAQIA